VVLFVVLLPEGHQERSPGLRRFAATLGGIGFGFCTLKGCGSQSHT
jgi:hypothetical protein